MNNFDTVASGVGTVTGALIISLIISIILIKFGVIDGSKRQFIIFGRSNIYSLLLLLVIGAVVYSYGAKNNRNAKRAEYSAGSVVSGILAIALALFILKKTKMI